MLVASSKSKLLRGGLRTVGFMLGSWSDRARIIVGSCSDRPRIGNDVIICSQRFSQKFRNAILCGRRSMFGDVGGGGLLLRAL